MDGMRHHTKPVSGILVVEDDKTLNEGIAYALKQEGYEVFSAFCAREAAACLKKRPGLILLDINLPDGDGRDFLRALREEDSLPVILLTARDTEGDMLKGFDDGCDDYITKPFSMQVLIKRIQAVLKRVGEAGTNGVYRCGPLSYDFSQRQLFRDGVPVSLTATQTKLLELFIQNKNQVLTKRQLLENIWDAYENYVDEKTLNVNIRRLREKVEEDPGDPRYIRTRFGIGYTWSDENESV